MLNTIATIAAMIPMLLHSVFGCCWHHRHLEPCGHSHTEAISSIENAEDPGRESCCDDHESSVATFEECEPTQHSALFPPIDGGSKHECPCSGSRCVFVTTSAADASHFDAQGAMNCVPSHAGCATQAADLTISVAHRLSVSDAHYSLAPKVRRSLMQLWLI